MTRIAIIGCGRQAPKHISGLRPLADIEVVLADAVPARAEALAAREGLGRPVTVDEALADPAVDAVDICAPTPAHAPLIRRALEAGKDFFCEKPLCRTAAEARRLKRLAEASGRIGMVGYIYRYAPGMIRVREILGEAAAGGRSPVLGHLRCCTMRIGGYAQAGWKYRRSEGGGAIPEMLVHMLDLALWYFGPLSAGRLLSERSLRPESEAEDFVVAQFETASGVPVTIQADLVTPAFSQVLEVQGENGTVMASIQPEMPQFVFLERGAGGYPAGRTAFGAGRANLYRPQMAAFVQALRRRAPPVHGTLAESVRVLEAVEMMRADVRPWTPGAACGRKDGGTS